LKPGHNISDFGVFRKEILMGDTRPNIILIITDQQRYDTIAERGFHQRYPVENKDRFFGGERWFFDEWDKALAAQGLKKQQRVLYRQRADYGERLGAFDWELPEDTHSDFFVGNMAKWWLDTYPQTKPLFLEIGFPGPHPPYDPIRRYAEPYLEKDLPILGLPEGDLEGQPPPFQELRKRKVERDTDSIVHSLDPTPEQMHRHRAYYLANVTMIDEKVGEILDALDRNGYLENSIVIFTSDHGDCLCDHGHSQKGVMYDIITRVPAIVWSPWRYEGGRRVEGLCQWMDIGPTVLDMAGVEIPHTMEAVSLMPALEAEAFEGRDHVFTEFGGGQNGQGFMTMVRNHEWKLVDFLGEPYGQLFDLKDDPDEIHNLWDDPGHQDKKREMREVMRDWLVRSNFKTRDWLTDWR
jgi:arylsulfatase A-like enzyme